MLQAGGHVGNRFGRNFCRVPPKAFGAEFDLTGLKCPNSINNTSMKLPNPTHVCRSSAPDCEMNSPSQFHAYMPSRGPIEAANNLHDTASQHEHVVGKERQGPPQKVVVHKTGVKLQGITFVIADP